MQAVALPHPSRDLASLPPDDHASALAALPASEAAPAAFLTSTGSWIAVGVAAWVVSGFVIALALGRRGHETRTVGALGFVLGPLLLGMARSNIIPREAAAEPIELDAGSPLAGDKRALVVLLGAPGDVVGALPYLSALGHDLGEVVMIRPISFEAAEDDAWDEVKQDAAIDLREAALLLSDVEPRLVLVPGRPERAIRSFLERHECDVAVAVGEPSDLAAVCRDVGAQTHTVVFTPPDGGAETPPARP